jgi:transcriptional regulator with XRE-family HTH domain
MGKADDLRDPEFRRTYEEEFLIAETTATIEGLLTSLGISQRKLADRLDVSESRVSQILSGEKNVTLRTLAAAGWALGLRFKLDPVPLAPSDRVGTPAVSDPPPPAWLGRLRNEEVRYAYRPDIQMPRRGLPATTVYARVTPIELAEAVELATAA